MPFLQTFRKTYFPLFFLIGLAGIAHAAPMKGVHSEVELIADKPMLEPGKNLSVALRFKMDPGWHIYWKNPGDSGSPAKVTWDLPEGFSMGGIEWPYPRRINVEPLTSYGYEGEVFLLNELTVPQQLSQPSYEFKAHVEWLICEKICLPAEAEVSLILPSANLASLKFTSLGGALDSARKKIPLKESPWTVSAYHNAKEFIFKFTAPSPDWILSGVEFFPDRDDRIQHAAVQAFRKKGSDYYLTVLKSSLAPATLEQISGVFVSAGGWNNNFAPQALEKELTFEPFPLASGPGNSLNIFTALVFAFLGGLILNLMPCVLPVLSVKVMNLVEHKTDSGRGWKNGLVFTLGVLVSFWALAGILLVLKSGGQQIGWGFQFQSPIFLIGLSIFFFIFALNLWGVFEIGTSLAALGGCVPKLSGYGNHFMTGVMATIVATPCTAPFMGTAIGFALLQPPGVAFLIFSALGFGMALPYLVLSMCPALLKFIPKPGRWMIVLKKVLAVFLLLTVVWLLWILVVLQTGPGYRSDSAQSAGLAWQKYSPELVSQLRRENKLVFIDFTAAWCLTCQVNDRLVLQDSQVVKKFEETGVVPVKADWTAKDESITRALSDLGRNSIPVYVLYGADPQDPPMMLPEILTRGIILEALEKIKSQ